MTVCHQSWTEYRLQRDSKSKWRATHYCNWTGLPEEYPTEFGWQSPNNPIKYQVLKVGRQDDYYWYCRKHYNALFGWYLFNRIKNTRWL